MAPVKFNIKRAFSVQVGRIVHKIRAGDYMTADQDMIRALRNCQEAVEVKPPKQKTAVKE